MLGADTLQVGTHMETPTAISRRWALLYLMLLVPLGLLCQRYNGVGSQWVNHYAGDICYEIFWCLFLFLWMPTKTAIWQIPGWVFGVTCAIEVAQLGYGIVPVSIRTTWLWRLLLGSTFDGWDFVHYAIGCLLGAGLLWWINRQS